MCFICRFERGQIVKHEQISLGSNNIHSFDVSTLESGVYIFQLLVDNQMIPIRFIKE